MSSAWNKDVFVALAAVAWADGALDGDEADAIVRAAADVGLELDDIAAVEAATREPIALGAVNVEALSKDDRLFVYAVAAWIAAMDGKVTTEESAALAALADKLGIPERRRAVAEKLQAQVAALPEGDRPARYDLDELRALLGKA